MLFFDDYKVDIDKIFENYSHFQNGSIGVSLLKFNISCFIDQL